MFSVSDSSNVMRSMHVSSNVSSFAEAIAATESYRQQYSSFRHYSKSSKHSTYTLQSLTHIFCNIQSR